MALTRRKLGAKFVFFLIAKMRARKTFEKPFDITLPLEELKRAVRISRASTYSCKFFDIKFLIVTS